MTTEPRATVKLTEVSDSSVAGTLDFDDGPEVQLKGAFKAKVCSP